MTYATNELSAAVGIPETAIRMLMHRGQFVPENGRYGSGRTLDCTRADALQLAVILALRSAEISLRRAQAFWRLVSAQSDVSNLALYVLDRPDDSDCDFRLAPANGPRPGDVPEAATKIDVGDLQRQLSFNLDQLDARRIAADFAKFPHRMPFLAPNRDAPWSIFFAQEEGEPDAEAVARMQDAIEAGSHLLVAGTTKGALYSLAIAVDRMLNAAPVQSQEPAERVH